MRAAGVAAISGMPLAMTSGDDRASEPGGPFRLNPEAVVGLLEPAWQDQDQGSAALSSALSASEGATPLTATPAHGSQAFGAAGSARWSLQIGAGFELDDTEEVFILPGVAFSYFMAEDISAELELNGIAVNQSGEDALGGNFNLLLRWHVVNRERWSLYVEGGAGVLVTSSDVPSHGSSFNFTPQLGGGVTRDIGGNLRLFAGVRAHHISNANTYEYNPGRDSLFFYAGISLPF